MDPVYNVKAIRGMLTQMTNNPGRLKGKRILYIHTGTIFHHYIHLPPSYIVFTLGFQFDWGSNLGFLKSMLSI